MLRNRLFLIYWLFLLTASFSLAQSPTMEQLVGTWIGESVEVDKNTFSPLPYRISFQPDTVVRLTLVAGGLDTQVVTWWPGSKEIEFDSVNYNPSRWVIKGDQLTIQGMTPLRFRRLHYVPLDSAKVVKTIMGQTWSTDSLSYRLYQDGSVCLDNLRTGNTTLHYWNLVLLEGSLFLVIKGTHIEPQYAPHYTLQVVQTKPNTLVLRGWNGRQWGDFDLTRTGTLDPNQNCRPTGFQLCNTFLLPTDRRYPYYEYKRGRLGAIRRLVAREFRPVSEVRQSGLVRFRFVVNCQGKAGLFELLTLDENYERCQFDKRITDQLQQIVEYKIIDWEPGKGTGNDAHNTYDTSCLLTFRFKDGQIVEIFP